MEGYSDGLLRIPFIIIREFRRMVHSTIVCGVMLHHGKAAWNTKVKGPVHPRWPVQPHPGDHQGKVRMNTTTPGEKKGTRGDTQLSLS